MDKGAIFGMYAWAIQKIAQEPTEQFSGIETSFIRLKNSHANRPYHNWLHVVDKLAWTVRLFEQVDSASEETLCENILADFYHDSVYDSKSKINEEESGLKMQDDLRLIYDRIDCKIESHIARINQLILATKNHLTEATNFQHQIMIDGDLAILQYPKQAYDRYALNVRAEYSWVEQSDYVKGRTAFLENLLQKNSIYYHQAFLNEETARSNIKREILDLRQ